MTFAGSLPALATAVLFTGLSVGPMLVTVNDVVGALAPVRQSATAMSYLTAGSVVGIAAGATGAGALADSFGSRGAFAVAVGAAATLLALVLTRIHDPAQP
jgi:predicted MFS family arabinose efflux permease